MFAQLSTKEKLIYVGLAALALGAMGYAGAKQLQPAPEVKITPLEDSGPSTAEAKDKQVLVDIAGAVQKPGVYRFKSSERVLDALARAGGPAKGADLEAINKAAILMDGTQLFVPYKSTYSDKVAEVYKGRGKSTKYSSAKASSSGQLAPGSISINAASVVELDRLPGIGPAIAQRIVEFRNDHGPFRSIDELTRVKGIGASKLSGFRKYLRL